MAGRPRIGGGRTPAGAAARDDPARSRSRSGRTTPTSSGDSSSSSATSTMPRTWPRRRTSGRSGRGTGSTAPTSGPGCTRSACDSRSTSSAATAAGWRRSSGSSRGVDRIRPIPTCGPRCAALDVRTRSALLLNVVDGYTQREIATMLAVPEGTVASWLSRGRAALRRSSAGMAERGGRRAFRGGGYWRHAPREPRDRHRASADAKRRHRRSRKGRARSSGSPCPPHRRSGAASRTRAWPS